MSTLWNDLVLSTADLHLSLIRIKSIMFFDLWSGDVQVHLREGLCLKIMCTFKKKIIDGQGTQSIIKNLNLKKSKRFWNQNFIEVNDYTV